MFPQCPEKNLSKPWAFKNTFCNGTKKILVIFVTYSLQMSDVMKSESRIAANLTVFHCVVRVSKVQKKAVFFQYLIVTSSHILVLDEFFQSGVLMLNALKSFKYNSLLIVKT